MATALGFPGYRYAVVEHPISSLNPEQSTAIASIAAPQVLALLRGELPQPPPRDRAHEQVAATGAEQQHGSER